MTKREKVHNNVFDHFFGEHLEAVRDFLKYRLPGELLNEVNLTTLERKPDTFVKVDHHKPRNADFVL